MSDAGWIEHHGGLPPTGVIISWMCRDGSRDHANAFWAWDGLIPSPNDVLAYRLMRGTYDLADHMAAPGALRGMVKVAAPLTRAAVLDAARQAVTKDRAATHGALEDSFAAIAAIWSVRLGVTVSPAQVAIMMVDLKTVRAWGNAGHADNWVDIAGYAACGGELSGAEHDPE